MAVRFERGFLLGKFLPPHAGHLHLVREARQRCDALTVLVCTLRRDPIPGALRAAWMRELCPGVNVVHVDDEVPAYPHEHPDFWNIWTPLLRSRCPDAQVVFSSERYGDEIARRLGIAHVAIDPRREACPVSATAVRADPLAYWEQLGAPVRAYLTTRVAIVGPESTGKTTLTRQLAGHYGASHVAEYGREHTLAIGPREITPRDFEIIAAEQLRREEEAARAGTGLLFCDTEAVVTEAFAALTIGAVPASVSATADRHAYDLYLLLDIDAPWVDDGTRWYPGRRAEHMARIVEALERRGRSHVRISGDFDTRFQRAVRAVDETLARIGAHRRATALEPAEVR